MAFLQTFTCNACGYTCMISGKKDALMSGPTLPCACTRCRSLVDVLVGFRLDDHPVVIAEEECPACEQTGGLVHWNVRKRPCPRCPQGVMQIDPEGMALCAD
jgi:hypothetical protein